MSLTSVLNQTADDLVDLVAPLARRIAGVRRMAVATGETLEFYEATKDGLVRRIDGSADRRGAALLGELRLPQRALLETTLSFPAATAEFLKPVIDNRLERLTPWAPDRVVYGYHARDAGDGAIAVRFVATARETVELWVARAEAAGFSPTVLGSAAEPMDTPVGVDLWRGARDPFRRGVRKSLAIAAVAVVAVLLPLTAWSFWSLHLAERRLEAVEARSSAARDTLRRSAGLGAREADLIGAKRPDAAIMTLVDRLATALPDGAVLRDLEIDPDKIRLAGTSDAAPELISLLEASGAVADVRFAAPVTRNPDGSDGFEILGARVGRPSVGAPGQ